MWRAISRIARLAVSSLPENAIRFLGSLQFRLPLIGPWIGKVGRHVVASEGVIKYGVGAGLSFDATGANPGYVLGTADPLEQEALLKYLKTGGVFYDLGANVGFFCVLARRLVGPHGRVVAFEPHPEFAERIRKNAQLNNFEVDVIESAVADVPGDAGLVVNGVSCPTVTRRKSDTALGIQVVVIDDLVARKIIPPPNYVVVDVEGAEQLVLTGMTETLREFRPVVLCEVHWLGKGFVDFLHARVFPLDYVMKTLDGKPVSEKPSRYHALLVPREKS